MKFKLPVSINFTRISQQGDCSRPFRDWMTLVLLCVLAFLVSLAWNTWFFYKITNQESTDTGQMSITAPAAELMVQVREIFSERAKEEMRYRTEYRFVDPSI